MKIFRNNFKFNRSLIFDENNKSEGDVNTRGYFKKSNNKNTLVSIITVVLNGEKNLDRTIQSVINQTYENLEYIIIDGGSTDGTISIINKYKDKIDYWISKKDNGLYDAMNKGIDVARGNWINFMNAGDEFYDHSVLKSLFTNRNHHEAEIIYGNHEVLYPTGHLRFVKAGKVKNLWKGETFSHQSSFVKTNYLMMYKFNHSKKIAADFEFYYKAWKNNAKFKFIDLTVVKFESGGVSDVKRINSILERWGIVENTLKNHMYYCMLFVKEFLKILIKRFVKKYN